jgi:outer membrane translocation and assembly module TamA
VTSRFVPLSERFTAGGDTSHRAYPLDLLGDLCEDDKGQAITPCDATLLRLKNADDPTDTGRIVPLGGNGLLLFNAEYRFPIFSSVGGAVFTDIGNVYAKQIRFDDLKYGVGVGLRYLSPVGPLRFDIGWPIERRAYDPAFSYFVTLGYAF